MPKKRVKTSTLWVFALILLMSTMAVAQVGDVEPKPILNSWGMAAPFFVVVVASLDILCIWYYL